MTMENKLTAAQQASAINEFVKKLGYQEGLDVIRNLDIKDTIAVNFEGLKQRPNHPITALFKGGLFHFDNLAHLKEVFGEVLAVVSTAYGLDFEYVDFYSYFEFLIPASPVVNLEDYEVGTAEDADEDEFIDGDSDELDPLDIIDADSDEGVCDYLEPTDIDYHKFMLVFDDDDAENADEFGSDYDSFARLYQAFSSIVEGLGYHPVKQVTYTMVKSLTFNM